jgi:glyoxylase-like metal-dependent hydrolase (beta-lactamase superfamily II)
MGPEEVARGIYVVGGSDLTDSRDCSVYLIDVGELLLIDTGAGQSVAKIIQNIAAIGGEAADVSSVILTHCHIDHVGGAPELRQRYGARLCMHRLDADAVERGDQKATAAYWYNLPFPPTHIDVKLSGETEQLQFGDHEVTCLHTPGHTPGSISIHLERDGERILFGQDIHGPFFPEFGSNMADWERSMRRLLALEADILCEGHFGVIHPKEKVAAYIERYLDEYGA